MTKLEPGQKMPDVEFTDAVGAPVRLSSLLGKKTIVLYFYPKDGTSGCTIEACAFRDSYEAFTQAGADVIGVSRDDADDHAAFKSKNRLPFTLLTDKNGDAAKGLGVKKVLGLLPGRVTFVIDRDGVLRNRFDSAIRMTEHVNTALDLVKSLESKPAA